MTRIRKTHALAALIAIIALGGCLAACGESGARATEAGDASSDAPFPGDAGSGPALPETGTMGADGSPDSPDATADAPVDILDAGTLLLPQVQDISIEGGVLPSPKLIAVTFPGDDQATQIATFTSAIGASAYWAAVTSEYGVGPAVGGTILETETAPATIDESAGDSEAWLATRFDGTHPEWGTFDPSAVYLVFYPSSTIATPSVGGCGGAYHDDIPITLGGADGGPTTSATLIYGVVFRCATSPDVGRPSGVDLTTFMASHEMIEALTDPLGTGYLQTSGSYVAWAYFFGSEVGDMCAFHPNAAITPSDIGFAVQRTWSNAAAAAFEDPCVPAPAQGPLFLAAPLGQNALTLETQDGPIGTQGFAVAAGQSVTIDVGFYGAPGAAIGPWTVTPFTYAMEHGDPEPYLQFSPSTLAGQSGDVVPLTITRVAADTAGGNGGDAVKLVSTIGDGGVANEWYFAVAN